MSRHRKVFVDPLMFPWAECFYLQGLVDLFGKQNVIFDLHFFAEIPNDPSRPNTFNFVINEDGKITKYAIDWFDANTINNKSAYDWCDVYGKVNTNWTITPLSQYSKVVSIPPSMGVKYHTLSTAIHDLFYTGVKAGTLLKKDFLRYSRYYYREYKRVPLSKYLYDSDAVKNGYVFFLNTLWYDADWNSNDMQLNNPRYLFMKYVSEMPFISFEGGFVPHNNRNRKHGYVSSEHIFKDLITKKATIKDYIKKT